MYESRHQPAGRWCWCMSETVPKARGGSRKQIIVGVDRQTGPQLPVSRKRDQKHAECLADTETQGNMVNLESRLSSAFIFSRVGSDATGLACVQPRAQPPSISLETLQWSMKPSIYRISRRDLDCLNRSRFAWPVKKVQDTLRGTWGSYYDRPVGTSDRDRSNQT